MSQPNALSIDVEDYFHASALRIPQSAWHQQEQRANRNTLELLEILARTNVKATFFVLGWVAERQPTLVEAIAAAGHEVACHGYSHELIYRQSPEVFLEESRRAKKMLESIVGRPIHGYRAASFSIIERSTWALDIIAELGFSYDSSIFPIYHDRYGIRGARAEPHVLRLSSGRSLVEIPPAVLSLCGLRVPVAGGGYFRLYPYDFTRWAIRRMNRDGRPAVVYLHPWEIDTGQPEAKVGPFTRFRHYVNIGKVRKRLQCLLEDFSFVTMGALAERLRPDGASMAPATLAHGRQPAASG